MVTRILHLSDFHVGNHNYELNNLRAIAESLAGPDWEAERPDAVVITGDIIDGGLTDEVCKKMFEAARQAMGPLLEGACGIRTLLVPGNHDYGWHGTFLLKKDRIRIFADALLQPDERLKEFPLTRLINGHLFIGVNSMEGMYRHMPVTFGANGRAGIDQRERIRRAMDGYRTSGGTGKIIIYLHHHPFLYPDAAPGTGAIEDATYPLYEDLFHEMEDGSEFLDTIKGADILLFGHEHRHLNFTGTCIAKKYGITTILSQGKSTEDGETLSPLSDKIYECTEYEVNPQTGAALLNKPLIKGLLGRLVTIFDDGSVKVETRDLRKYFTTKARLEAASAASVQPERFRAAAFFEAAVRAPGAVSIGSLQPCDVLLYRYHEKSGPVANMIRLFDGSPYYHAAVFDGKNVVEAVQQGVVSRPASDLAKKLSASEVKVDAYRFISSSGVFLGETGYPPDPVLAKIGFYSREKDRYAYEELLLLALLAPLRKPHYNSWIPGLAQIIREVLEGAAGVLVRMAAAGKEPMICSELVYRCFAEAAGEKYALAISDERRSEGVESMLANERSISPLELESIRAESCAFIAHYQRLRKGDDPDFVTPRDLCESNNLKKLGSLVP